MATIVVGLGFTACSVDTSGLEEATDKLNKDLNEAADEAEAVKSTLMYQCPDNCDNGPTYPEEGPCNKCGKDMVEI